MDFTLRAAVLDDADDLGALHIACWREAYPHLLSEASFRVATPEWRATRWARKLAGTPTSATWLAESDGELIGFASSGTTVDADRPRELELQAIYVLAKAHGTGVGQALLDAAVDSGPACLWVAEDNPRAQAFYRRNGFELNGTRKIAPFVLDEIAEVRMVR
jgi:ribosomal protein S18 acetylase RimI-like enzyme